MQEKMVMKLPLYALLRISVLRTPVSARILALVLQLYRKAVFIFISKPLDNTAFYRQTRIHSAVYQFQFISLIELEHQGKTSYTDRCP